MNSTPSVPEADAVLAQIDVFGNLFVGVAVVLLSAASVFIARAANRSSRIAVQIASDAHDWQVADATRRERAEIVDAVLAWCVVQWGVDKPTGDSHAEALRLKNAFSVRLFDSKLPGTGALQNILWEFGEGVPKSLGPVGYASLAGGYTFLIQRLVAEWVRSPEKIEKASDRFLSARFQALGLALEKDKEWEGRKGELTLQLLQSARAEAQREQAGEDSALRGL